MWIWHAATAYNAVENHGLLHDTQHLAFFVSGLVFWWPVIQAPPFQHALSMPMRVGYLVAGTTQRSLLGAFSRCSTVHSIAHNIDILRIGALSPLGRVESRRIDGAAHR